MLLGRNLSYHRDDGADYIFIEDYQHLSSLILEVSQHAFLESLSTEGLLLLINVVLDAKEIYEGGHQGSAISIAQ